MKAKVAGLIFGVLACCVVYAGYGDGETIQWPAATAGPGDQVGKDNASPSENAQPGAENTLQTKETHEHPGFLMVQGWPVDLPYHECGNVIVDAMRQNRELYVADEPCRAAMRKAFEIQRTTPPPDPREVQQAISGPEVPTEQSPPQTGGPAQADTVRSGERVGSFLKRIPN